MKSALTVVEISDSADKSADKTKRVRVLKAPTKSGEPP